MSQSIAKLKPKSAQNMVSLNDRYSIEDGDVFLNGTQALVRVLFDQHRRDKKNGLRTASFVTGYPGSPLAGIDNVLASTRDLLSGSQIVHAPAQNEELAATSLMGTQMLDEHPNPDLDGVIGVWYGKGPGVDRSGDALKHGNFAGTSKNGAVVILSGEDHEAKSSTVPCQQEFSFESAGIPVLYPGTVAEFLEFGQHAIEMSRYSGCWVALKLVGPLCDSGQTVSVSPDFPKVHLPEFEINGKEFGKTADFSFFPGFNLGTESSLYNERHEAVKVYTKANKLNRTAVKGNRDKIGIIAAGKTFYDVRHAFKDLGFSDKALNKAGIRLMKIGVLCPLEADSVTEFAQGLDEVIVVEEKRDFLERQIARAICKLEKTPRLLGKRDETGKPLFPIVGGMETDDVARILFGLLRDRGLDLKAGDVQNEHVDEILGRSIPALANRMPNFCSGCPHNIGTRLAPGQTAWGSPGCHAFAALMPDEDRTIKAMTQYGGEGLPWIGLSPFTPKKHMIQNVGDGSIFHSSYLNIRYAVSAGVSMTFKILYNSAIANTGGQAPTSGKSVQALVKLLAMEGVERIAIITRDPSAYNGEGQPANVSIHGPDEMEKVQLDFEKTEGVTVLLHDGDCANERRRKQKRGKLPKPVKFTVVNEDVCENCGHCGELTNCMSLQKVDTEFGLKTQIHQSSCNQDQSCIGAECPSFVTVKTVEGNGVMLPTAPEIADDFPSPNTPELSEPYSIYIPGLGGTGVITVNAILAQAATMDGKDALSFDQTGAAQKWGAVLSSLIVAPKGMPIGANSVGVGRADLYIALDLMAAGDKKNLTRCVPKRTAAIINSAVLPNGAMIRDVRLKVPVEPMVRAVNAVTDQGRSVTFNARAVAEAFFGNYIMTNMVAVGAAYQAGLLPISADKIEAAIALNGVKIKDNITAFRAGRMAVTSPESLAELTRVEAKTLADRVVDLSARKTPKHEAYRSSLMAKVNFLPEVLKVQVVKRALDLVEYQNIAWANKYVSRVAEVAAAERRALSVKADLTITESFAQNLHKLMAYKDEYEVARHLTQKTFHERTQAAFKGPVKIYYNLQPPLLRFVGLNKKVPLGPWFTPVLRFLAFFRRLRGTPFDVFGYVKVRKEERRLIPWYNDLMDSALARLNMTNQKTVLDIAAIPEEIRGYEEIKIANIERANKLLERLLLELDAPRSPLVAAE